jgi:hypothetical protein
MESDPNMRDSWWEFQETILHFQDNKVFNTRQAEEFFKEDNLIATKINSRFYSAYPGLLTSVGLLLTFSAILVGLSHIHPDAQGRLSGVEDLVYSRRCSLGLTNQLRRIFTPHTSDSSHL